jgi:hypothetical protein
MELLNAPKSYRLERLRYWTKLAPVLDLPNGYEETDKYIMAAAVPKAAKTTEMMLPVLLLKAV